MLPIISIVISSIGLAPLSCLVLWNRQASFTDALIHACIFGVLLSSWLNTTLHIGTSLAGLLLWGMVWLPQKLTNAKTKYSKNIAFQRHEIYLSAMFISSVAILMRVDYIQVLFGSPAFVTMKDLMLILGLDIIIFGYIAIYFRSIILSSINEELALGLGIKVGFINGANLLLTILSVTSVVCILGGGFFVVAAMLLPGAISSIMCASPKQTMMLSVIVALFINISAIVIAEALDVEFAPLTIVIGYFIYLAMLFIKSVMRNNAR